MKRGKIHPGIVPIYFLALVLAGLSLNTAAGFFVFPVACCGFLALLLSLWPRLRFLRWIGNLIATAIVGLYIFVLLISPLIEPVIFNRESKRVLKAAPNADALREAVGSLGLFLPYTNGQWIAIRYNDSHGGFGWSSAIALDSNRNLYKSKRHFCGCLSAYRSTVQRWAGVQAELKALGETNTLDLAQALHGLEDIHRLAIADGLSGAIPVLKEMGFQSLDE